jgi:hypothetical protein
MTTPTYGQPATIAQIPTPAATVNIASSTNATPTVITTATAHGLHTGQAVIVYGHLVNTAANGIWIATVLTTTTFKISTLSGFPGTFVAGSGIGGATGTVQSLALPGVSLPQDLTDDRDSASVNVPFEYAIDSLAWLTYKILANMTILSGGSMSLAVGAALALAGDTLITGPVEVDAAAITMGPGSRFLAGLQSRKASHRTRLTAADHTVTCGTHGPDIILAQPTGAHTITISQASDTGLANDDELTFWLPKPGADPASNYYRIKREGSANYICVLWGKYFPAAGAGDTYPAFCKVHVEGGVWRLSGGAGVNYDTDA